MFRLPYAKISQSLPLVDLKKGTQSLLCIEQILFKLLMEGRGVMVYKRLRAVPKHLT